MDFSFLKAGVSSKVDENTLHDCQLLCCGYIHNYQQENNACLVPEIIVDLIGKYGKSLSLDTFDLNISSFGINLDRSGILSLLNHRNMQNIYGSVKVEAGKCHGWRFKIENISHHNFRGTNIGIIRETCVPLLNRKMWWSENIGYSIFSFDGKLYPNGTSGLREIQNGDTLDMFLDLRNESDWKLKYVINDDPYICEIAVKYEPDAKYRMVISLGTYPTAILML